MHAHTHKRWDEDIPVEARRADGFVPIKSQRRVRRAYEESIHLLDNRHVFIERKVNKLNCTSEYYDYSGRMCKVIDLNGIDQSAFFSYDDIPNSFLEEFRTRVIGMYRGQCPTRDCAFEPTFIKEAKELLR